MMKLQDQENLVALEKSNRGFPQVFKLSSSKDHIMITLSDFEEEIKVETIEAPKDESIEAPNVESTYAFEVASTEVPKVESMEAFEEELMEAPVNTPKRASIEEISENNIQNEEQGTLSIQKKTRKCNNHVFPPFRACNFGYLKLLRENRRLRMKNQKLKRKIRKLKKERSNRMDTLLKSIETNEPPKKLWKEI
jgi:hypothetical protein